MTIQEQAYRRYSDFSVWNQEKIVKIQTIRKMTEPLIIIKVGMMLLPIPRAAAVALSIRADRQ